MRKNDLVAAMRDYSSSSLSPTPEHRALVSQIYGAVKDVLGSQSTIQIGSFARYTAIKPLHDLDVLYVAGDYQGATPNPNDLLDDVRSTIDKKFINPTTWQWQTDKQTHSVTIVFTSNGAEMFSVDIVPAYRSGKNEFALDTYIVPEIINLGQSRRRVFLTEVAQGRRSMGWIKSDPRGYTEAASQINAINSDFRRASKILKGWRRATKARYDKFPLKSFHLEQAVYDHIVSHPDDTVFDAIFHILRNVRSLVAKPRFRDRADGSKFIDEYLLGLSSDDRELAEQAADHFLIGLEKVRTGEDIADLFSGGLYKRCGGEESFLFDQGIPMFLEHDLNIVAEAAEGNGFRRKILDAVGWIARSRDISFRVSRNRLDCDLLKWKVKNDNSSAKPRGEITDHRTKHDPEFTSFLGNHYVECYAIKNGVCIGMGRQNVRLNPQNTE